MNQRWSSSLVGSALLAVALCACDTIPDRKAKYTETRTFTLPHEPDTAVQVEVMNGRLSVLAEARADVLVTSTLKAVTEERLRTTEIRAERDGAGCLNVEVLWPDNKPWSSEGCNVDIRVPAAKGVRLRSSNGSVEIGGLSGKAELETSNGAIRVERHQGPVVARTSNGRLRLHDVAGDLVLRTSNGAIEVKNAGGQVRARTSNGGIRVELAESSAGPVHLESSNGSITLDVGAAFAGDLQMQTSSGRITVDDQLSPTVRELKRHRALLGFGDSGASSVIRNSNGSIAIR